MIYIYPITVEANRMLLKKKTILFCEEKRFSPAACVIEVDSFGANITVTPSAEKVFLYCDCGFSEAEKRRSVS